LLRYAGHDRAAEAATINVRFPPKAIISPYPNFPVLQAANHEKIGALFLIVGVK